jgi:hypothetical protein
MGQKIYYDGVNSKEVVDVSGVKDEQKVKDEFGLDPSVQIIEVDTEGGETHYVDNGTLKKKTKAENDAAHAADKAAKDAEKKSKEDDAQAALKLTDAEWAMVKAALT